MKKTFLILLSFLFSCSLLAEEDFLNGPFPSLCGLPSFSLDAAYIDIRPTTFRTLEFEEDHLKYREIDLNLTYLYPFNDAYGISFGAGFIGSEVNWERNPFFEATKFEYVTFTIAGINQCIENWVWKGGASIFLDTAELSLSDYALYRLFLYGKYALCQPIMLNVGFILELGLNKAKIWPVLGFDYYLSKQLNFHLVFPLDVSLEYFLLKNVSIEGSLRFLRNRHRVKNNEPLPMAIFEYETIGLECDLNYFPLPNFFITGFIGSTGNGDLKITDRNNHHAVHAKFRHALYAGASANLSF
jgi:hypothetical protein